MDEKVETTKRPCNTQDKTTKSCSGGIWESGTTHVSRVVTLSSEDPNPNR
jgi:hypothetical protein